MFVVDNETPDVSRPYPTMAVAGNKPVTLVNAAQLSFYLRDAAEEAAGASLGRIVCPRPIIETAEKARESEKPERALAPEEEWYETYRKVSHFFP